MKKLVLATSILIMMTAPCAAVDFSKVIEDSDGKPVPSSNEKDAPPLTLGRVASIALFNVDPKTSPTEKYDLGVLGTKIATATGDITLTAEETTKVKDAIGKTFGPLVVYRAWSMLDPGQKN